MGNLKVFDLVNADLKSVDTTSPFCGEAESQSLWREPLHAE